MEDLERDGRLGWQVNVKREEEELVCRGLAVSPPGVGSVALEGALPWKSEVLRSQAVLPLTSSVCEVDAEQGPTC